MGFVEIEQAGKRALEQFPVVKRSAKRIYQLASVATSNEKFKSEGDIVRVSPDDGFEYFYGYYDKSPWDATDRYMICMKVKQAYKSVAPKEPGVVGVIDTQNGNKFHKIGVTHAWNVQQSCMAQWMGPDYQSHISYDFINKREERVLPMAAYVVARDGSFILSLDFSRLHRMRPGYGYSNLVDKTKDELCPDKACIWKVEVATGEVTELFKYTDFAAFEPDETMKGADHKVNHLMISPNGKRFMVLHRWFQKGRKHTRLVTVNIDKTEMYTLSDDVFVSHCYWKNDEEILSFLRKKETGDHYYLMKDKTQEYKMYWSELNTDGHCSYSPDGKYIITDTYPNRKRIASVYLCTEDDNRSRRIARVFSPFRYDNVCRCDLHPRWNRTGDKVCIDSVHEGRRGLFVINLAQYNDPTVTYIDRSTQKNESLFDTAISKIEHYHYVSFDIFDTLIKRDVAEPKDVFKLMEKELAKNPDCKVVGFCEKRLEAEKKVRLQKKIVNLEDIYAAFEDTDVIRFKDQILKLEEELEYSLCIENIQIKKIFDWCINQNKSVILISDMYLSVGHIEKMLHKCGIQGYQRLFISNSCQKRKASHGELFKYACDEMQIKPTQLIHIGDSLKCDIINAQKSGCETIHVKRNKDTKYFHVPKLTMSDEQKSYYSMLKQFCNNRLSYDYGEMKRFGYEVFGPLLAGFCIWLNQDISNRKIDKLFFFARDGLIIKNAYEQLYGDSDIKTFYLEVSRRSLRVPQLWMKLNYEDVINSLSAASVQSITAFFEAVGLEFVKYVQVCEEEDIYEDYEFKKKEALSNDRLRKLYNRIEADIYKNSRNEYESLCAYLKKMDFKDNIAVIESGWRASMQNFLISVIENLKLDVRMHGYYVGLAEGARIYKEKKDLDFKGYVFDCVKNEGDKDLRNPFVGLIETLFLANTGSTKNYYLDIKGEVHVNRYLNEYEISPGVYTTDSQKILCIQQGALCFINDVNKSVLLEGIASSKVAFENLYKVGIEPTGMDIKLFGDMEFRDGNILHLAKPRSLLTYVMKPSSLVRDFYNSRWKIGFMKRLLKLPLPYEKMYEIMKRL